MSAELGIEGGIAYAMVMHSEENALERQRNAEEERHYWDSLEDARQAEQEREAQKRADAIETMETWFFEQFEDPQVETPRDSEEQSFFFAWGGPFEASDVLHGEFSQEYDEETIEAAAEHIERNGTYEWAPTSTGDFYEHPDPEPEDSPPETQAELTGRILERLKSLEELVASLPGQPGNIGHNAPPDEVGLPPYSSEEVAEIGLAVVETRDQLADGEPDPDELTALSQKFDGWGSKLGLWLAKKGDLVVDEIIKNSVKVLTWTGALAMFQGLAHDLIALAEKLITRF